MKSTTKFLPAVQYLYVTSLPESSLRTNVHVFILNLSMASHAPTLEQTIFRPALEELLELTLLDDLYDELLFDLYDELLLAFDDEDFLREEELFPLALDSVLLLDSDNSSPCPATSSPHAENVNSDIEINAKREKQCLKDILSFLFCTLKYKINKENNDFGYKHSTTLRTKMTHLEHAPNTSPLIPNPYFSIFPSEFYKGFSE